MKKINGKSNITGNLIQKYREKNHYTKADVSRKLQLLGINIDGTEIKRIECGVQVLKDFELIALCIVLQINYDDLKKLIDQ